MTQRRNKRCCLARRSLPQLCRLAAGDTLLPVAECRLRLPQGDRVPSPPVFARGLRPLPAGRNKVSPAARRLSASRAAAAASLALDGACAARLSLSLKHILTNQLLNKLANKCSHKCSNKITNICLCSCSRSPRR